MNKPQLSGRLNLTQGEIYIPKANIVIDNLTADALVTQNSKIDINATADILNKPITFSSVVSYDDGLNITSDLNADNIMISNTPCYAVTYFTKSNL